MRSERLQIQIRSHAGENIAMLLVIAAGVLGPLILLATGG